MHWWKNATLICLTQVPWFLQGLGLQVPFEGYQESWFEFDGATHWNFMHIFVGIVAWLLDQAHGVPIIC